MSQDSLLDRPILTKRLKLLKAIAWGVSILVFILVILMRSPSKIELPSGVNLSFFPMIHAILNSLVALCLLVALWAVKKRNFNLHKNLMTCALVFSSLFLLCYVSYHFTTHETKYGGGGAMKAVYFILLISHIISAAVSFPFILRSFIYAWCNDFKNHRKIVRWVYPLWLYVAITGPICYLMLRPYYS